MATTGELYPTQVETVQETPWIDDVWTITSQALGPPDGANTIVDVATFDSGDQTWVLKLYNYGVSIPAGSTIDGVIVRVKGAEEQAGAGAIGLVQLLNTSRAKVGTNLAATEVAITTTPTDYAFGSSSNLWGNALTEAWVENTNFGVAIGFWARAANTDVVLDACSIEVFYSPPATAYTDAGTVVLALTPSGTETKQTEFVDSGTVYLNITTIDPATRLEYHIPAQIGFSETRMPPEQCVVGPYKAPNDAFYCVLPYKLQLNIIQVFKATDPTSAWNPIDNTIDYGTVFGSSYSCGISTVLDGDLLHILHSNLLGIVSYSVFDTSTDTWLIEKETIEPGDISLGVTFSGNGLAVRSDGTVVAFYTQSPEASTSSVYYRIRSAGSWGSPVLVSTDDTFDNFHAGPAVLDDSDRVHLSYICHTPSLEILLRTLSSTGTLSSPILVTDTGVPDQLLGNGIYIDNTEIGVIYNIDIGPVALARWDDIATPTATLETVGSVAVATDDGPLASIAAIGNDLHIIWVDGSSNIYHSYSLNGGSWVENLITTGSVGKISANVLDHNGTKLGYFWNNGTVIEYDEIALANVLIDSGTVRLVFTPSAIEAKQTAYADSGTERISLTPSATESREITDAETIYLGFVPSAIEIRERTDAGTALIALTPSGADSKQTEFTDSDTVRISLTPSAVEIREQTDASTVRVAFTPSGTETQERVFFDQATVSLVFTASSVEERITTDAQTASLLLTPSSIDISTFEDTAQITLSFAVQGTEAQESAEASTVRLSLTPSGVDEFTGVNSFSDSGTVSILFVPSASDTLQAVEAEVVFLRFTPNSVDTAQFADANAVSLILEPSGSDSFVGIDLSTATIALRPSGTDIYETTGDVGTIPLALVPSSTTTFAGIDAGTTVVVFTPSGSEDYFSASNVDEATAYLRFTPMTTQEIWFLFDTLLVGSLIRQWSGILSNRLWSGSTETRRWSGTATSKWSATISIRRWSGTLESRLWSATTLRRWFGTLTRS